MQNVKYLAYGSNLHPIRMRRRTPSAKTIGVIELRGWALKFHKRSTDGSAKCNLVKTAAAIDLVYTVVYELSFSDKSKLDRIEGAGFGYEQRELEIDGYGSAFFYVAPPSFVDDSLRPYRWYKRLVVKGAQYHRFPGGYVRELERVQAVADPLVSRRRANLRILEADIDAV